MDCDSKEYIQKRAKYEAIALKVIEEKNILQYAHIFTHTKNRLSKSTAYNYNLEKLDSLKEAIENNQSAGASSMLSKWISSDNATLQIAAMRIIGGEDIRRALNQQYIESKSEVKVKEFKVRDIFNPDKYLKEED